MDSDKFNIGNEISIRKSMLGEYSFCPLKFKKGWWRNGLEGKQVWKSAWIMLVGTRFHDFADQFWDYQAAVPVSDWELMIPKEFTKHEREMAVWFLNLERNRKIDLEDEDRGDEWRPVAREMTLKHRILNLSSTFDAIEWWDKENGELCMVEYKTGNSWYVPGLKSQLSFYAMLWNDTMNFGNVTKLKVINPNLKKVEVYDYTYKDTSKILKEVVKLRTAMRNDGPWPAKCSPLKYGLCKKCSPSETSMYDK